MYNKFIVIFLIKIIIISAENNRGSLTFVIDRTRSMRTDIGQLKTSTNAIANKIFNKNTSQIQNMVLVAFDDPDTEFLIETTNITEFNKNLDNIMLLTNYDCPEMSLKGTLLALEKSRPESYVYVFTDDSPKEIVLLKNYTILDEIVRIAQNNGHQIMFVVSPHGICRVRSFAEDIKPYYDIAAATSGQVFVLSDKTEVQSLLDYVKETVSESRTVITSKVISPHNLETIPFTVDTKMEYAIISTSANNVELHFNNNTIRYNVVIWLSNVKVIKIADPGEYEIKVKGDGVTSVLVFGRTDLMFNYGFSELKPELFNESSKILPSVEQLYLSIQVTDNDDVNITTAELSDMNRNILQLIPLKLIGEDEMFYVTNKFDRPRETFILSIIGQTVSNETIRRTSRTPISVSSLH